MRLAKDLQCRKVESYAFAAKSIDEIGRLASLSLPDALNAASVRRWPVRVRRYPAPDLELDGSRPACQNLSRSKRHFS
jgi:hypothetical protein